MKRCSKCGASLSEDTQVCAECGAELREEGGTPQPCEANAEPASPVKDAQVRQQKLRFSESWIAYVLRMIGLFVLVIILILAYMWWSIEREWALQQKRSDAQLGRMIERALFDQETALGMLKDEERASSGLAMAESVFKEMDIVSKRLHRLSPERKVKLQSKHQKELDALHAFWLANMPLLLVAMDAEYAGIDELLSSSLHHDAELRINSLALLADYLLKEVGARSDYTEARLKLEQMKEQIAEKEDQYHIEVGKKLMEKGEYLAAQKEFKLVPPDSNLNPQAVELLAEVYEVIRPPLSPVEGRITKDAAGVLFVHSTWKNVSQKTIESWRVRIECYDKDGDPAESPLTTNNIFSGQAQHTVPPGEIITDSPPWNLKGYDQLAHAEVFIINISFADGSEWTPPQSNNEVPHLTAILE